MRAKAFLWILSLVLVLSCGKKSDLTAAPQPTLKPGWTSQNIASEKSDCESNSVGLPNAAVYCGCYVDKSSKALPYTLFRNPGLNTPAAQTLAGIDNECSAL